MSIASALGAALRPLDIALTRRSSLERLRAEHREAEQKLSDLADRYFVASLPEESRAKVKELLPRSTSQIRQDLFALASLDFKRDGYFVEFGACDGMKGSNTFMLERDFGWNGVLAEPAHIWHSNLGRNRCATISTKCVWSRSGEMITFKETTDSPGLSTIGDFSSSDRWALERSNGRTYQVQTISLLDLLEECRAPREIDYLSIDTEGSELEILSAFDFSRYRIGVITCEHNFTPARKAIHELLASQGYARRLEDVSQFDDWYVNQRVG